MHDNGDLFGEVMHGQMQLQYNQYNHGYNIGLHITKFIYCT